MSELENESQKGEEESTSVTDLVAATYQEYLLQSKKNAWKAFGRLCTAVVDFPVASLEGRTAERRAESAARVKLIETSSNQIADQMMV